MPKMKTRATELPGGPQGLPDGERARDNMDAVTAYTNDGQEAAVRDILGKRPVQ